MNRLLHRLRLVICVFCGIGGVPPVHAAVTPAVPPAPIASQPTFVEGQPAPYIEYDLTALEEAMLRENGFVVLTGARHTSLWAAYPPQAHVGNLFVTTDAMLELWYSLHRDLLKTVEKGRLLPDLEGIVAGLARAGAALSPTVRGDVRAQTALCEVMVTLKTAEHLLDARSRPDSDARVNARVDLLVRFIMAHNEMRFYPDEDYTQYTVRGHYADDPDLAHYFRASLWLSRRLYAVSPADNGDPDGPLRAAVAFAAMLRAAPEGVREHLVALNRLRQYRR
jgi:hypothetical protein